MWNSRFLKLLRQEGLRLKSLTNPDYLTLKDLNWDNNGLKAMNELERCLIKIIKGDRRKCLSYGICFPEIKSVRKEDWIYPRMQWAVL
ncbi:unnamed protein product [Enterobius vermicularis]|uniref:SAM domain-containing protein n=1 Tax=Enterobius vermicularis TaxID=51028 RepID=A0A0N4UTW6_ENTVE|nr:unnamed protein product [Enterobius vermicularis]